MTLSTPAVRVAELDELLRGQHFVALPAEEVDRYVGAIEVIAVEPTQLARDRTLAGLVTYTVLHHNYAWFTYRRLDDSPRRAASTVRSMGIAGAIEVETQPMIFCDGSTDSYAVRSLHESIVTSARYDLRMSGLLGSIAANEGEARAGIVYVARLRQPGLTSLKASIADVEFCGNLELQERRDEFDAFSQALIAKLYGL